jgi:hypothetical protein
MIKLILVTILLSWIAWMNRSGDATINNVASPVLLHASSTNFTVRC